MREIKFRAWEPKELKMWKDVGVCEESAVLDTRNMGLKSLKGETILMQYTGLKDKNGVKIYEGDVIEHGDYIPDAHTCQTYNTVVEYFPVEGSYNICLPTERGDYIKVIGNIYENPELLGE